MRLMKILFSPKTIWECFSVVLTLLGIVYCLISFPLYFLKKDIGLVFLLIGLGFLFVALCLWIRARIHHKKMDSLRQNGFLVRGKVLVVRYYRYINFSYKPLKKRHPWRLWYEYQYNGQTCRGHSDLLWEPPALSDGNPITVLIDVDRPRISCPDIALEQS